MAESGLRIKIRFPACATVCGSPKTITTPYLGCSAVQRLAWRSEKHLGETPNRRSVEKTAMAASEVVCWCSYLEFGQWQQVATNGILQYMPS